MRVLNVQCSYGTYSSTYSTYLLVLLLNAYRLCTVHIGLYVSSSMLCAQVNFVPGQRLCVCVLHTTVRAWLIRSVPAVRLMGRSEKELQVRRLLLLRTAVARMRRLRGLGERAHFIVRGAQ